MLNSKNILVTGGCGFIGSTLIQYLLEQTDHQILNVDALTYASSQACLAHFCSNSRYQFVKNNICNAAAMARVIDEFQPDCIMHLAAETHVDRSIDSPAHFIQTNIVGTYVLIEEARLYWSSLTGEKKETFRFHHISTDEVYGDLPHPDECANELPLFTEQTPYAPSSPYSASKASSDHLVRAWHRTYGLPVIITNCSNNYGPAQHPEKLIPKTICNALQGKKITIYGKGNQIRDWLYVEDHVRALVLAVTKGVVGETYNIGGYNELQNIEVIHTICSILDKHEIHKLNEIASCRELITFVSDRPGHDKRYAIDAAKISRELGWRPEETFTSGIEKTILWYIKQYSSLEKIS